MFKTNHTFAICAYKESPFLEECIKSLKEQTIKTNIIMETSTPNEYIKDLADKYEIPLYINEGEGGITQDWNYAYAQAKTDYVTIAHQDDVYHKCYVENLLSYVKRAKHPLLFFTDYAEIRNDKIVKTNRNLKIKRVMLFPMKTLWAWNKKWIRRRMLSFGSAICCPSVTYAKKNLPEVVFQHGFRADEDWQTWEYLSKIDGEYIFCNKILTYHRIHGDSETTKILGDNKRSEEDYVMYCKFWPKGIAKVLTKIYSNSEKSNDVE